MTTRVAGIAARVARQGRCDAFVVAQGVRERTTGVGDARRAGNERRANLDGERRRRVAGGAATDGTAERDDDASAWESEGRRIAVKRWR